MINDIKTSRREALTVAAGAVAAMAFGSSSAEALGTGFVIPPVSVAALAIAGSGQLFPVRRIYCVGRNYLEHIREEGNDEREPPFFFQKPRDALVRDGATIPYPSLTKNFHHEIELVVALKSGGKNIPKDRALDHVFGYAVGLDMTRRDLQRTVQEKKHPWEIGKSFDFAAPCGPLRTVAQVGHLKEGYIRLSINGQIKQNSDLKLMIWDVAEQIANLSTQYELVAGDIIYSGTPHGIGPVNAGDEMVGEIAGLGSLTIKVGQTV